MVMTVYGQEIACARAEKGTDCVRAYDENGVRVVKRRVERGETLDAVLRDYPRLTEEEKALVRQMLE